MTHNVARTQSKSNARFEEQTFGAKDRPNKILKLYLLNPCGKIEFWTKTHGLWIMKNEIFVSESRAVTMQHIYKIIKTMWLVYRKDKLGTVEVYETDARVLPAFSRHGLLYTPFQLALFPI